MGGLTPKPPLAYALAYNVQSIDLIMNCTA